MIITENGVGNYDEVVDGQIHDQYRIAYLEGYVDWIERAMEDGCTVLGYFVWSTMDVDVYKRQIFHSIWMVPDWVMVS